MQSKKQLKIGIFMGGRSIEAEVSFNSGRTICDHIDTEVFEPIPVFQTQAGDLYLLPWHFLHRGKIADFEERLIDEGSKISWDELPSLIDFAYLVQHGRFAEDGTLQGIMEVLQIPYLGSKILASAIGMNKAITRELLSMHEIAIPQGMVIKANTRDKKIINQTNDSALSYPLIVKPAHEGSSHGVFLVNNEQELVDACAKASTITPGFAQDVIVESYEEGIEFSCITIQKNGTWSALSVTELIKNEQSIFDYQQKYMPGRMYKKTPARLPQEIIEKIQTICIQTSKALDFKTIGRIDGIYTSDGRIVIIDPNSLSGMAPNAFIFDQAALHGWSHKALIHHLISEELQQYGIDPFYHSEKKTMNEIPKVRIGVMFGGNTHEKEVSLDSGRNVIYKLSRQKYHVTPLFIDQHLHIYAIPETWLIKNSTHEIAELLKPEMRISWSNLKDSYDFIFLGMHGGSGENGSFQGFLEMLDIPYNGSSIFTSALCMDKYKTNEWLAAANIKIPQHQLIDISSLQNKNIDEQKEFLTQNITLPFPIICKPHDDGCSVLVAKINHHDELLALLPTYFEAEKTTILCEEYIEGTELTVGVLGNENPTVFPASQAMRSGTILSMEEKFLPGAGENQTPALISKDAQKLVTQTILKTYLRARCQGYARIDCFYQNETESPTGKERVVIIEINTLPALTPATCLFHQAAEVGIRPAELLDRIIELGFEKQNKSVMMSKNIALEEKQIS